MDAKAPIRAKAKAGDKPAVRKLAAKTKETNGHSILHLNEAVSAYATPEQVAERAYFRWLERGCPMGSADEDWFYAERELSLAR